MKDNKFLQGVIGLLAVALIIFVGAKTRNAFQEYHYIGTTGRDTIQIGGYGKVSATPDLAQASLGITTDGAKVADIQTQNTQKMNAIVAAVKAMGVEDKDIQTSNYSIYPKYDYSNGKQNIVGYTVSQNVTVKIRKLETVGDVLGKAGELGANQVNGLNFTIDDPTTLQAQARDKALADARTKADEVANKLGLHIVKVVTFSESSNSPTPPMPYAYDMKVEAANAGGASAPSVQSGSLDVESNVAVTYEVQ